MKRNTTTILVVHCAATPPTMDIGVKEIREWHTMPPPKGRGWKDIGYAKVIRRDGTVEEGRGEQEVGAHVAGYNSTSVGICLVGGIDKTGKAENNFTPEQFISLRKELKRWRKMWPNAKILGHRDLDSGKECPSFDVNKWLKSNPI